MARSLSVANNVKRSFSAVHLIHSNTGATSLPDNALATLLTASLRSKLFTMIFMCFSFVKMATKLDLC